MSFFLFEFFKKIFGGLFNAAQKTWNKISPELQKAMLHGSGIISVINTHVDASPDFIVELLQKKYPDLTKEKIHESLQKATEGLSIGQGIVNADFGTTIQLLQGYLSSLKGKGWANISQTLAKGITAFLAPKETKFAAISSLMEFVFQTFVKGK